MKNKNYKALKASILGISVLIFSQAFGSTIYVSGAVDAAGSWDSGLPGPANPGTIGINASIGATNFILGGPTTITHSAGTITGTPNLQSSAQPLTWIQDGGTVSATSFVTVNFNTNYELRSGSMSFASSGGGSRMQVANTGSSFSQTGGTMTGMALAFESASALGSLTGGVANDFGASWLGGGYALLVQGASVEIGGDYTANFNPGFVNASGGNGVISMQASGVLNFSSTWTGSFNNTAFNGGTSSWEDAFTATGIQVDGTQVTAGPAGNFGDFFEISNGGTTVTAIPEPSSLVLLGLAGLGILAARRFKR